MKSSKIVTVLLMVILLLAACGTPETESMTLKNHENQDVQVPNDKPVLFFFITTYT
ncbi:hypothetical protein [Salinibacillus xinjiangensis]|uniref:Uncharacterized protein n=1 Tax=Salinibacillus xinjiangensis TaxID=1229268 RepID=A0A6G1X536_9BACI|nr:hypothetical protein [Salinibacillus xinjiangensis]MRG86111.1 hypothetical protein [Salinibacillus xinjiangensis]